MGNERMGRARCHPSEAAGEGCRMFPGCVDFAHPGPALGEGREWDAGSRRRSRKSHLPESVFLVPSRSPLPFFISWSTRLAFLFWSSIQTVPVPSWLPIWGVFLSDLACSSAGGHAPLLTNPSPSLSGFSLHSPNLPCSVNHWALGGAQLETAGLQKLCQSRRGQKDIHRMTRHMYARGIRKSTPGIQTCMSFFPHV